MEHDLFQNFVNIHVSGMIVCVENSNFHISCDLIVNVKLDSSFATGSLHVDCDFGVPGFIGSCDLHVSESEHHYSGCRLHYNGVSLGNFGYGTSIEACNRDQLRL